MLQDSLEQLVLLALVLLEQPVQLDHKVLLEQPVTKEILESRVIQDSKVQLVLMEIKDFKEVQV